MLRKHAIFQVSFLLLLSISINCLQSCVTSQKFFYDCLYLSLSFSFVFIVFVLILTKIVHQSGIMFSKRYYLIAKRKLV